MSLHLSLVANIAITVPIFKLFLYSIPKHLDSSICIGKRVTVPFGSRKIVGFVIEVKNACPLPELKTIVNVIDEIPLFPKTMLHFLKWSANYYMYPLGKMIASILPIKQKYNCYWQLYITTNGKTAWHSKSTSKLEKKILAVLIKNTKTIDQLKRNISFEINESFLKKMELKKWIVLKKNTKLDQIGIKKIKYATTTIPIEKNTIGKQRRKILKCLKLNGDLPLRDLISMTKTTYNLIRKMEKNNQIRTYSIKYQKNILKTFTKLDYLQKMTQEQQQVVKTIGKSIGKKFKAFLLVGSDIAKKTEVFLSLTEQTISCGLSVLVLVPEITMVSQITNSFLSRFENCIAILHSNLSKSERYDQWLRILEKKATIVIGTRSCIFAPLDNLGLIIVDEEHDLSYKQEKSPFYNSKDLAIVRAKQNNTVAVLASSTPSIQSCFNTKIGKFSEVLLRYHTQKRLHPQIEIVNISDEQNSNNTSRYFTDKLLKQISIALGKGQQVLLFLNRRGFASYSLCTKCGNPVYCKNCNISLTLHKNSTFFKCHYCGFSKPYDPTCPLCNSSKIKSFGIGTEQLEIITKKLFPKASIARVDKDTSKKKGFIARILKSLEKHEIDILIGTQIITKNYNFSEIALIGIICADLTMNFPDFRSSEKTFQLLTQVVGCTRRGNTPIKVILQTYNPKHYCILAIKEQNFYTFYEKEIKFRKLLMYPPFSKIIQLKISGKNKLEVKKHSQILKNQCQKLLDSNKSYHKSILILGPIELPLSKINGCHRWQLILKSTYASKLHAFVNKLSSFKVVKRLSSTTMIINVDPISMM